MMLLEYWRRNQLIIGGHNPPLGYQVHVSWEVFNFLRSEMLFAAFWEQFQQRKNVNGEHLNGIRMNHRLKSVILISEFHWLTLSRILANIYFIDDLFVLTWSSTLWKIANVVNIGGMASASSIGVPLPFLFFTPCPMKVTASSRE